MNNRQIAQHVKAFRNARGEWMERLNNGNPDSVVAAQHVLSINSKIELLLTLWNWYDDSAEYPAP